MTEEQARSTLSDPKSYATVRDLPGGGVAVSVVAQKGDIWGLAILMLVIGPLAFFGGLALMIHKPTPQWMSGPMSDAPVKLLVPGAIVTALGPLLILIRLMSGPPRNVELEARAGELKADRSIAGDRVRSTYTPGDVHCLFTESAALFVETRKGHSPLIGFGTASVNQAVAYLLASHFWGAGGVVVTRIPKRLMSHMPEKMVFSPGVGGGGD
jgi:hypothetical protein